MRNLHIYPRCGYHGQYRWNSEEICLFDGMRYICFMILQRHKRIVHIAWYAGFCAINFKKIKHLIFVHISIEMLINCAIGHFCEIWEFLITVINKFFYIFKSVSGSWENFIKGLKPRKVDKHWYTVDEHVMISLAPENVSAPWYIRKLLVSLRN